MSSMQCKIVTIEIIDSRANPSQMESKQESQGARATCGFWDHMVSSLLHNKSCVWS